MTTAARDLETFGGVPIRLYEFSRTTTPTLTGVPVTTRYRYTSADRDVVVGGDTYAAITISDEGIRQSGSEVSDQLTVSLPAASAVPQLFLAASPEDPIGLLIRLVHQGETDPFILWAGTVGAVRRNDEVMASLICNTAAASLARGGLRLLWSRNCPHALYDNQCRADPTSFTNTGTILAKSGVTILVSGFDSRPNGYFHGGWLEKIDADGHAVRRMLTGHFSTAVAVLTNTHGFEVGDTVYGFAGCDRSSATCQTKFNNLPNYGGFDHLPGKSPFDGTPVF